MIATHSPRKDRGSSAPRRGFGWRWLALCAACLVPLVWLVIRDAPIARKVVPARRSIEDGRRPGTRVLPEALPTAEADPLVEPLAGGEPRLNSTESPRAPALLNGADSQKMPFVSKDRDALALRSLSIRKIEATFEKSPVYELAVGQTKSFTPRTWLRVVVTFDTASTRIAELSFRYRISIGDEIFTGTITHIEILGAGEHQVAAYVIPSVVEPLLRRRDFIADKTVRVEVEALNGDIVLSHSKLERQTVAPRRERPDFLRSVEETPFAPLEMGLYERTAP